MRKSEPRIRGSRLDELLKLAKHVHPYLASCENVVHVDVGFKYVAGCRTDTWALRIFISGRKLSLRAKKAHRLAPPSIKGAPLDVIPCRIRPQCGVPIEPTRLTPRMNLRGGVSIGTASGAPGTLGALVYSRKHPGLCGLTALHVAGTEGTGVFFPSPRDAALARPIGQVVAVDYNHGASLIRISDPTAKPQPIHGIGLLEGFLNEQDTRRAVAAKLILVKSGRRSGITRAQLDGIAHSGALTLVRVRGQRLVSCGGDSGSIWMTRQRMAVGLHFGGNESDDEDGRAFAYPMYAIERSFGLTVDTPPLPNV